MISTVLFNLPSNIAILSAGDRSQMDVSQVRKNFNEGAWMYSNHFRAMTCTLATFCLSLAIYLKLRATEQK